MNEQNANQSLAQPEISVIVPVYQVERFLRDAVIAPNIEGSADIQRLIAGSYILKSAEHFL